MANDDLAPVGYIPYNISRTRVYKTLAAANADTRPYGYWEMGVIKGDNTRRKFGDGERYSGTGSPDAAPFRGSTFAQLPWEYNSGSTDSTPNSTYAANATAVLTTAQLLTRYITSTSAAATALTLPTATLLGAALNGGNGAVDGTQVDFKVDNSAGANPVSLVLGTGMTLSYNSSPLVVPTGAIGQFRIIFTSATTAIVYNLISASLASSPASTFAANATATLTAAQLINKYITSTSAAATGLTLPTATLLGAAINAVRGTKFTFTVDNSAGASTVTMIVGTGITAGTPVITGGAALTVASGQVGEFIVIFITTTTALIYRSY